MINLHVVAISVWVCCCMTQIYSAADTRTTSAFGEGRDRVAINFKVYSLEDEAELDNSSIRNNSAQPNMPNLLIIFLRETTSAGLVTRKLRQSNVTGDIDQFAREIHTFPNAMKTPSLQLSSGKYTAGAEYKNGTAVFVVVVVTKSSLSAEFKKEAIVFSIDEARKYFSGLKSQ